MTKKQALLYNGLYIASRFQQGVNHMWVCLLVCALTYLLLVSPSLCGYESRARKVSDVIPMNESPIWNLLSDGDNEEVVWRARIGTAAAVSPVVVGDRLLVGTRNEFWRSNEQTGAVLMCLRVDDGSFLWQAVHRRLPVLHQDFRLPINSRPFVDGNRVYYVSNRGELMCLDLDGFYDGENDGPFRKEERADASDADIVWSLDMVADLGVYKRDSTDAGNPVSSPVVVGDMVYCVTGNGTASGRVPHPEAPSFIAVNKVSGSVVWSSNAPGKNIIYGQFSSPVFVDARGKQQIIFPGGDGVLYAFEALTGEMLWNMDLGGPFPVNLGPRGFGKRNFFVAEPTVQDGVIYIGLNQTFESRLLTRRPVYAIELFGGGKTIQPRVKWMFDAPEFDGTFGAAAVADGKVYVVSRSGTVFAIDAEDGKELWRSELGEHAAFFASPVVDRANLYVPHADGLYVFSLGDSPKCLGSCYFPLGPLDSTPLIAKDRLFIAASGYLWALKLPDNLNVGRVK